MAVPRLPADVWREILGQLASSLPPSPSLHWRDGSASTRWYHESSFGWPTTSPPTTAYLSDMVSLSLISSEMWGISCEFLYESVVLRTTAAAEALAAGMTLRESQGQGRDFGTCTKQLLILPCLVGIQSARDFMSAVRRVLHHCPKLRVIVLKADMAWVRRADFMALRNSHVDTVLQTHAHDSDKMYSDIDRLMRGWTPALQGSTEYRSLRALRITALQVHFSGPLDQSLNFPNLERLCVDTNFSYSRQNSNDARLICNWRLDSLTHLYIGCIIAEANCDAFYEAKKPTIIFLHIGWRTELSRELAARVLKGMPNLCALEYSYLRGMNLPGPWAGAQIPNALRIVSIKIFESDKQGNCRGVLHGKALGGSNLSTNISQELLRLDWRDFRACLEPLLPPNHLSLRKLIFVIHHSMSQAHRSFISTAIPESCREEIEICEVESA